MRDIIFEEVGMQNFGPYIDPMIHTFQNDTLTLMTGPNGIGKTMSLDAIPFTLYGITSKGAKGDDLVNNVTGKNCKTWVKFKINENQYLVTRYQKYSKRGNTVVLNVNGVDAKSGHREVVPEIERLICPSKTFMNTLMFGQKVKDFFTDLVDSDKKQIFRMILALEKYLLYYKEADKKLKEARKSIETLETEQKVKQGLLADAVEQIKYLASLEVQFYKECKQKIEECTKSIAENKRLEKQWKEQLKKLNEREYNLDDINSKLNKITNEIENLSSKYQGKINELKAQSESKKHELKESAGKAEKKIIEEHSERIGKIQDEIQKIKAELNDYVQKKQDERHGISEARIVLEMEQDEHQSRIDEIKANVLDREFSICPTCEQDVNDTTRKSLLDKVMRHEEGIITKIKQIEELNAKYQQSGKELADTSEVMNVQIEEMQRNIKDDQIKTDAEKVMIQERLQEAFSKVDELTNQKEQEIVSESKTENEDLLKQREETLALKAEAEHHNEELLTTTNTLADIETRIKLLENEVDEEEKKEYDTTQLLKYQQREYTFKQEIQQITSDINRYGSTLGILEFWKTAFSSSGIPSMLIDEAIPFMNKQVSEYLDMLTNGRYIVSFDTLAETKAGEFRDKISVRVLDTHTQANSRVQLSGGQTRIVDIATILTLGDLQSSIQDMKINILLFDEIFDALDDENIGYVAKVLNKIKVGKSIYIISHQHQDQVEADQSLTLS